MILQEHQVKTYGIIVPLSEWQTATCEEYHCPAYQNGWIAPVLEGDHDMGDKWAYDIRHSKYKFTEHRREDGYTVFTFEPGQPCFRGLSGQHKKRKPNAREIYVVRDGRTGQAHRHVHGYDWVDDFANHQDVLASAIERG